MLVLLGAAAWSVLVFLPDRIDNRQFSTKGVSSPLARATIEEGRLKARDDATTVGVQLLAALAVIGGGFLTWRTIRVTRDGQLTDRFTAAVEHLGSDKAPVRVGAIYALGRIARDSRSDRSAVVALLAEHLRESKPWPVRTPEDPDMAVVSPVLLPHPEVRAVAAVLAECTPARLELPAESVSHRLPRRDRAPGIAGGVQLQRQHLTGAVFSHVDIRDATWEDAITEDTRFEHVKGEPPRG